MKTLLLPATLFMFGMLSPVIQAAPSYAVPYIQMAENNQPTLNEATQSIKHKTGGRILSANTIEKDGQRFYEIKVLLPSGKVRIFRINAQ
jgi:hypothetical protein